MIPTGAWTYNPARIPVSSSSNNNGGNAASSLHSSKSPCRRADCQCQRLLRYHPMPSSSRRQHGPRRGVLLPPMMSELSLPAARKGRRRMAPRARGSLRRAGPRWHLSAGVRARVRQRLRRGILGEVAGTCCGRCLFLSFTCSSSAAAARWLSAFISARRTP